MPDDVFGECQNLAVQITYIIHNGHILLKVAIIFHNAKKNRAINVKLELRVSLNGD